MHLYYDDVNEAFTKVVSEIHQGTIPTVTSPSRYGDVISVPEPVTITYKYPLKRVLFNSQRDVNPFSNLYESLWVLAGRNDVTPLAYYCSRMQEFSDDGTTLNDAYGYRWRNGTARRLVNVFGNELDCTPLDNRVNQLAILIDHLKNNPHSRRAYLTMWTVEDDLLRIDNDKAVCCNVGVKFRLDITRCTDCKGRGLVEATPLNCHADMMDNCPTCTGSGELSALNMTVFNRSNDLVWGTFGANICQFSFLQEYMAAHLGVEVGVYNQITDDLHAYTERWDPDKWLSERDGRSYERDVRVTVPLVKDPRTFEHELPLFVEVFRGDDPAEQHPERYNFKEPFLEQVAKPMCWVFRLYKKALRTKTISDWDAALRQTDHVVADDWRLAGQAWLRRRFDRHLNKTTKATEEG